MKKPLWLLLCDMNRPDAPLAMASLGWMARECGADFECYLEAQRDGKLFARTGSTVLGGAHHGAFNYLCAAFDVSVVILGEVELFESSLALFQTPILARAKDLGELYDAILPLLPTAPDALVWASVAPILANGESLEIAPYLFPEIVGRRALALDVASESSRAWARESAPKKSVALFLDARQTAILHADFPAMESADVLHENDTLGQITLRIARRWQQRARGVAFGDPPVILSQMPMHIRQNRVAVWGKRTELAPREVKVSGYVEQVSEIADETALLAREIGNPVLIGRQTGDGDIFRWSQSGVCIQITDPNRPVFPVVETLPHVWGAPSGHYLDDEPDDKTLLLYAQQNTILASVLWHSGEVAHNEAMLNLFEVCAFTGVKMGIGAHAARYTTCPQTWEMLAVSRERGGVRGLIEPVLHCGGMGVMAEVNCPPAQLQTHCETALRQIRDIAGESGMPRGYYAFCDTDLDSLQTRNPAIFGAVQASGLEYFVSSARPGRNQVLWQNGDFVALNQSPRVVHGASPFVRVTTSEDLSTAPNDRPGWMIGTLDAPVISFNPYIWRHGARFMALVSRLQSAEFVNVLPHTIARYARLLKREGFLP